jgi:hypothetical protein
MARKLVQRGANAVCSYQYQGVNTASVRVSKVASNYTVISEESHARQHRAFYPHRRSQGTFSVQIDCKGWAEFRDLITWFRAYATMVLNLSASVVPPPMFVVVPSRDFLRLGIPTTGLQYGDHIGSMVFSPVIQFLSVSDPNDPSTSILKTSQVSSTKDRLRDPASNFFYPDSIASYPGQYSKQLYDLQKQLVKASDVANDIAAANLVAGIGLGALGAAAAAAAAAAGG